jgi:HAD superfamily hydrolase (TIGR01490 family)
VLFHPPERRNSHGRTEGPWIAPGPGVSTYPDPVAASPDGPEATAPVPVANGGTSPAGRRRSAAFFDLDKTVIARSSVLAFSRSFYAGGLINRWTLLRSAYVQLAFLTGPADHDQIERMRRYLSEMSTGWDVAKVRDIVAETLTELIQPAVYSEATALMAEHHAAGRDVVLVSASGTEVVEPIGLMLGADDVIATRMVVEDGRFTGDIAYYAYGQEKARAIRELAERRGYDLDDCYAYSDSITDLPMLSAVGHPAAVNPDRGLRREAVVRGWQIMDFTKPVALRSRVSDRMPRVPAPTRMTLVVGMAGAAAVGAAGAAAGIAWVGHRRAGRRLAG